MKNRNMVFDFTQCYPKRKEPGLEWHDCSAIGGSRLYCSRDAEEKIKALIAPVGVSGIHFIDSGDYHYISKIMTDFIKEPFTLVLIDHHTDMQDASLGGDILSCGNWAKKVLQENPYLQKLVLIGQEKKMLDKLQSGARQQETDGKLVEIRAFSVPVFQNVLYIRCRRQNKSFLIQQFFKNVGEAWASSPHLRSKSNCMINCNKNLREDRKNRNCLQKSKGYNDRTRFQGQLRFPRQAGDVPQPCRTGLRWFL